MNDLPLITHGNPSLVRLGLTIVWRTVETATDLETEGRRCADGLFSVHVRRRPEQINMHCGCEMSAHYRKYAARGRPGDSSSDGMASGLR